MNIPLSVIVVVIIVFGFLTGSSLYFFNKNTPPKEKNTASEQFSADIPSSDNSPQANKVDELTKPADVKGRVTYPSNVYTIGKGETLFGIGAKFDIDWKLIMLANDLKNENVVQSGKKIVIPKLSHETDYYRINFSLDADNASTLNRELRAVEESDHYDPTKVAMNLAVSYFSILETDKYTLLEQDVSRGTALVEILSAKKKNVVGLFQPKQKGERGFWTILYIEHHE